MPPLVVVFSAPSGAGKSTVIRELLRRRSDIELSVSHTTRAPRPGEQDGVDYHFVTGQAFDAIRAEGSLLEWAEVYGNAYGTSRAEVDRIAAAGKVPLLEVDTQGAAKVMEALPDVASIFMVPPSLGALEQRLRARGTESAESLALRLSKARAEIALYHRYRYTIVNERVDEAVAAFAAIVDAERLRSSRAGHRVASLLHS